MRCVLGNRSYRNLMTRLAKAGFKRDFVSRAILPDWWSEDCVADASILPEIELRAAAFLSTGVSTIRDPEKPLVAPEYPSVMLRRTVRVDKNQMMPAIHAASTIARAVVRNLKDTVPEPRVPTDPQEWRSEILEQAECPDLDAVADSLWHRGIPVIHVDCLPSPRFQAMACIVQERPVVIIGHRNDQPAKLLFHCAHEIAHISAGDCRSGPVVDEADEPDASEIERSADEFAILVLNGQNEPLRIVGSDPKELATAADEIEQKYRVDAGHVILSWARAEGDYVTATLALSALWGKESGGKRILHKWFQEHVDVDQASEGDGSYLRCVVGEAEDDAPAC